MLKLTSESNNLNVKDKYMNAINNFKDVQNSKLPKFEKMDIWLEKESRLYKEETKEKSRKYIHLKRGTLIKVDFGINLGSELCHTHFAIVLSKYDNINKVRCSKEVLNKIDDAIIENITGKKLINLSEKEELLIKS